MKMLRACGIAAVFALALVPQTQALAQYYYGPPGYGPYGRPFGFRPYGFYRPYGGFRGFNPRLSYGTGYRGRGTRTGGPAGGLPSRN